MTDETERFDEVPTATRRNVAKYLMGLSGAAAVGGFTVTALTGLSDGGQAGGGGGDELWVKGTHLVNEEGDRIKLDAQPSGAGKELTVLPEKQGGGALKKKQAATLLVRFTEDAYADPTKTDWTAKGYVAYSMVCTHEGCMVSGRDGQNLFCPCHGSTYSPTKGAEVVDGPAPRSLPQLPLGVTTDGGLIVATGSFEGPVGPGGA